SIACENRAIRLRAGKDWVTTAISYCQVIHNASMSSCHRIMQDDQQHLDLNLGEPVVCRSVWISDIHLGTRHARVAELLEFLRAVDCKYLYLVGDFIDG